MMVTTSKPSMYNWTSEAGFLELRVRQGVVSQLVRVDSRELCVVLVVFSPAGPAILGTRSAVWLSSCSGLTSGLEQVVGLAAYRALLRSVSLHRLRIFAFPPFATSPPKDAAFVSPASAGGPSSCEVHIATVDRR